VRKVQFLLHAYVPERKIAIKYVRGPQTFTCYLAARLNRTQLSAKKKRQKKRYRCFVAMFFCWRNAGAVVARGTVKVNFGPSENQNC
jgi:hypothetical protein